MFENAILYINFDQRDKWSWYCGFMASPSHILMWFVWLLRLGCCMCCTICQWSELFYPVDPALRWASTFHKATRIRPGGHRELGQPWVWLASRIYGPEPLLLTRWSAGWPMLLELPGCLSACLWRRSSTDELLQLPHCTAYTHMTILW